MTRPRHPSPSRAFTLIEVLLAVAIFGVVLVAIHGVFHGALRLRNRTVDSIEHALPLEHALAIVRRDLAGIVAPGGTLGGALESMPIVDGLLGQPTVQFHTASAILSDANPWPEIQRVAYILSAPTNNQSAGRELHRAITRNLLPANLETIEDHPLLTGVDSLVFSFFDGSAWRQSWSTNEATPLPRAIRLELVLVETNSNRPNTRPQPIEMVVNLLVEPATNAQAQAQSSGDGS